MSPINQDPNFALQQELKHTPAEFRKAGYVTFNDVMDQNDKEIASRSFYLAVIQFLTGAGFDTTRFSPGAQAGFFAIGHGMRLVIDHTNKKSARLVDGLSLEKESKRFGPFKAPLAVPSEIAQEMIESGLMSKYRNDNADYWRLIK